MKKCKNFLKKSLGMFHSRVERTRSKKGGHTEIRGGTIFNDISGKFKV